VSAGCISFGAILKTGLSLKPKANQVTYSAIKQHTPPAKVKQIEDRTKG